MVIIDGTIGTIDIDRLATLANALDKEDVCELLLCFDDKTGDKLVATCCHQLIHTIRIHHGKKEV